MAINLSNLFNSMRERKYEMALIRTLGSSRRQLSMMIIFESLILTTVGFFIGGFKVLLVF